ncbi:UbiA prenyltransferase family [Fragilaria crotonensis]|nr:UbiA prenyltransferase family [Fragilaria crotonensis]
MSSRVILIGNYYMPVGRQIVLHRHRNRTQLLFRPLLRVSFSSDTNANEKTPPLPPPRQVSTQTTLIKAYLDLSKARLSALVVATTAAGFLSAGGPLGTMGFACAGTALCSSSAAALNQVFEISRDSKMKRTQQRPLVQGTLSVTNATMMASVWGVAVTTLLAYGTDPYTTALGVGNIALYSGLYTYLKPRTIYNTWVGAVVGAIPPVIGWSAATSGHIFDVECLLLGSTLYLWQMPHFFALSYMHRVDYARGGFQMVPVLEDDGGRYDETAKLITRYAWYLSTIPVLSTLTGVTSTMFCLEGFVLNGYALKVAYDFDRDRTNGKARQVFLTSLWYLPCLLMLFLIHSKTWDEKESDDNIIRRKIDEYIHIVRDEGRKLCVHEVATNGGVEACPVVVAKKGSDEVTAVTAGALQVDVKQ